LNSFWGFSWIGNFSFYKVNRYYQIVQKIAAKVEVMLAHVTHRGIAAEVPVPFHKINETFGCSIVEVSGF
jgi:hypothetical protein